jgi:hypothetical protein
MVEKFVPSIRFFLDRFPALATSATLAGGGVPRIGKYTSSIHYIDHVFSIIVSKICTLLYLILILPAAMFLSLIFTAPLFSVSFARVDLSARDSCSHNNCLRAFIGVGTEALTFCQSYTPGNPIPSFASNCDGSVSKVVGACSCFYKAQASSSTVSSVVTSKIRQAYSFIILTYLEATSSIGTTTSTSISSSGKEVTKIRKS